jgi:glucose-1-phosphate thymidylyltransferase
LVSPKSLKNENSVVIAPCFIGEDVTCTNSIVGPNVSMGRGVRVVSSVVNDSIIGAKSEVLGATVRNSMVGERAVVRGKPMELSIGDDSTIG